MRYTWRCATCHGEVVVERRLADYQRPPEADEAEHDGPCPGRTFTRVITPPSMVKVIENFNPETMRE